MSPVLWTMDGSEARINIKAYLFSLFSYMLLESEISIIYLFKVILVESCLQAATR